MVKSKSKKSKKERTEKCKLIPRKEYQRFGYTPPESD